MTERKVIGIGETVFDIIFKNTQPISAVPGGSTFNALISLARAGISATFISETGNDRIGQQILQFLRENNINADNVSMFEHSKSPLSLAFLNEENDAEYVFYKDHPNDRLRFTMPEVNSDDIILFGSYYAINPVIRQQVKAFLDYAKTQGAILYYDVNFRSSHSHEKDRLMPLVHENFAAADVIRGSREDFAILLDKNDCDALYHEDISDYCPRLIYTQGADPVELRAEGGLQMRFPVSPVETVSTIGAGDNFNAGFIYAMIKQNITRKQLNEGLTETQWTTLINSAQTFSKAVCQTYDNYIGKDFIT